MLVQKLLVRLDHAQQLGRRVVVTSEIEPSHHVSTERDKVVERHVPLGHWSSIMVALVLSVISRNMLLSSYDSDCRRLQPLDSGNNARRRRTASLRRVWELTAEVLWSIASMRFFDFEPK